MITEVFSLLTPEIVARIKRLRSEAGLTPEQAAERTGRMSGIYWRHIELGLKRNPSLTVLEGMAAALGVSLTALISSDNGTRKAS